MTRTFKMKKILLMVLLLLLLPLCGCYGLFKTDLFSYDDEIFLTIKEEFVEYLPYDTEDIPTYTLKFPGITVNTTLQRTGENEVIFSGNDDFVISDIIEKLLLEYEEKRRISYRLLSTDTKYETHLNKHIVGDDGKIESVKEYLKVTDGVIENKIAYMTLENGLQLTINYRTFEGTVNDITKRYYSWQYTESVRLILYYPLMIVKNADNSKSILIVALPNAVINKIETRYEPEGLLEKDDYLEESYYTYEYPDYNIETSGKNYDATGQIAAIKAYYSDNFNGQEIGGVFYYDYLGEKFSVTFYKTDFVIKYIGPLI